MCVCLLLLLSMFWHRQAIFESKWDKLSSSAECRIRTQGLRHLFPSRLNAIEDQAKNVNSTARPYDQQAFSPLDLTASWLSHLGLAIIYIAYLRSFYVFMCFNSCISQGIWVVAEMWQLLLHVSTQYTPKTFILSIFSMLGGRCFIRPVCDNAENSCYMIVVQAWNWVLYPTRK